MIIIMVPTQLQSLIEAEEKAENIVSANRKNANW